MTYSIPSSRPRDWQAALSTTESLLDRCGASHPLRYWRERTAALLGLFPDSDDHVPEVEDATALYERFLVPAAYLCRFAHSLRSIDRNDHGARRELKQIADGDGFFHLEYMLHLASRIGASGYSVSLLGPRGTPAADLQIDEAVLIECRARGGRAPRATLKDDFAHAQTKFAAHRSRGNDMLGVLALDLGVCGSPALPELGRLGPRLSDLHSEMRDGLAMHEAVDGVVVTWVALEQRPTEAGQVVGPIGCSGWVLRDGLAQVPGVTTVFDPWDAATEIAIRTTPDGPDLRQRG